MQDMTKKSFADLPGPVTRWWGLPALAAMRRDYLGVIASQRRYGGLVRQIILGERCVDVFDPALVRTLMTEHANALIRWERGPEVFADLMGQSVLVTEGAIWQRQRRMLMPAFAPKRMAGYAALMTDAAAQGLDAVQPGEVAMDTLFSHLTMDVILRVLFSRPASGETAAASQAVQLLSENALREMFWPATLPDWLPLPGKAGKRRALHEMRALIGGHIARELVADAGPSDLLGMLQSLRDEDGSALSEQEVFDQCMVSFQAGHETSATALLWWSALMAKHPEAQQRARAEIATVIGARRPTAEDAARLPWLDATLKEAMRLYPPVAALMTRRLTREITLGDVTLPARTMLRVTPWVLHRDATLWPEPEAFRPERFMPDAAPPPRGSYLPFGTGPRVCLGQHFAVLEMTLIAAMVLQRFEISGMADALPPARMAVTLRPATALRLTLRRSAV